MSLNYFFSEKEGLIVISLKGDIDEHSGPVLSKCLDEASARPVSAAVLHMAEASLPKSGFRDFSQFLRTLKGKTTAVKISALCQETRKTLVQQGLLGVGEARDTLVEAVKEVAALIRP